MVIYPESFSVKPNTEAMEGLKNLFNTASEMIAKKSLTLLTGKYLFTSRNANVREMHISNTIGENEYEPGVKKNMHKCAIVLENVNDIEIDCSNSLFIMNGKMTHIVMKNCSNVILKNLRIDTVLPNVHKFTVVKASPFYVTFRLDSVSNYVEEQGGYYFCGTDYKFGFTDYKNSGYWMITARPENFSHTVRNGVHPFEGAASVKEISERVFSVRYITPKDYEPGQIFYFFPAIREEVGILVDSCKNITLKNIRQTYNNSLAFVAQNSENITLEELDFSPRENSEVDLTSVADFLQFSMCRGNINVRNCNFDNAGDDVCNVHGFHFKIVKADKDNITVKFCHPESYGFECFRENDIIAFIDPKTLLEVGRTKIMKATLRDEYYYDLQITGCESPLGVGGCIENISACPNFEFSGNTINRIVTRGVLATTRGRIRIENNKFLNTGMSGILISDDASYWYESGCVRDVAIRGNAFMNCDENAILIKPEIKRYGGSVHRNILIENNLFVLNNTHALNVSSTANVLMRNNVYRGKAKYGKYVMAENVENFVSDAPKSKI